MPSASMADPAGGSGSVVFNLFVLILTFALLSSNSRGTLQAIIFGLALRPGEFRGVILAWLSVVAPFHSTIQTWQG
jgi:hypothetical protein